MAFHPPIPILRIFDEAKAREFYLGFLGFTVDFEHRFDANAPLYMGVSRDGCKLHLSEHHGDACPGSSVSIRVDDLQAYHQELTAKRYKYYRPGLEKTEWNTLEVTVQDGFGNKLIFFRDLPRS
jgi:uncharacterized glyoxalase superfamily protein PhnB